MTIVIAISNAFFLRCFPITFGEMNHNRWSSFIHKRLTLSLRQSALILVSTDQISLQQRTEFLEKCTVPKSTLRSSFLIQETLITDHRPARNHFER